MCPNCGHSLERVMQMDSHEPVLIFCPACAWRPDKEAAKDPVKTREALPMTPLERHTRDREAAEATADLLALKAELELEPEA